MIMRDVLDWSANETAEVLELSVPVVKSALQRARATLREELPPRRSEWAPSTDPSAEERALLEHYMHALEQEGLPTRTNRQPVVALYLRSPQDTEFRLISVGVLRVVDGKIAEICDYGMPNVLAMFDLPPTL